MAELIMVALRRSVGEVVARICHLTAFKLILHDVSLSCLFQAPDLSAELSWEY
jgi:hypothetical protein